MPDARRAILELTPTEAFEHMAQGARLIDVREASELLAGTVAGSVHVPLGRLMDWHRREGVGAGEPLIFVCASGVRSRQAAALLQASGHPCVRSIAGGLARWRAEGLPVSVQRNDGDPDWERYARQIALPDVGEAGQRRLQQARVIVVGAGGLGSPAAMYLAAAGVGHLTIVDADRVERSNLHRQLIHRDDTVGAVKAISAKTTLSGINPSIAIHAVDARLTAANARELFMGQHVVVDCSDNFSTRYAVNDACVTIGIPLVHGAIFRFEGQVSVFWPARPGAGGPCYRCLCAEAPPPGFALSCADAGVLGAVPGIIGALQATEALKLLLGVGTPLVGRMLHYDGLHGGFDEFEVPRNPGCRTCVDGGPDTSRA